ncbi:MAG: serpin family protein [Actinomycetia bacterium]|nr:serpin family protein [Actinomycetes bacterium]
MAKAKIALTAIITAIFLAGIIFPIGCARGSSAADSVPVVSEERSDELIENLDRSLVDANTRFAFNIFRELVIEDKDQNIFISPLSILLALAMTYNGAAEDTSLAMADAMEFSGMDLEELNQGFGDLMVSILNADSEVEMSIANSIWQRMDFDAKEDFIDINKKYYNSGVRKLDFSDPKAVDTINDWISDATKEKITEMLDETPPTVVMYLINAIYFKGDWTYPFEEAATHDDDFYLEDGSTKKVPMMNIQEHFQYGRGDDYAVIRLPYGQEKFSMYIVLPDEGTAIDSIVGSLDEEKWNGITGSLSDSEVILAMPKYKMEYGVKLLNDSLTDLGMGIAFGPGADFSGISEGIFISKVIHKAVIEVNEKGSEAAAATVVAMAESAMVADEMVEFIVNRPFIFTISDDRTGSILFMGKVMEP